MRGTTAGAAIAALVVGASGSAWAAGLEKATLWSAPYAGVAGAAAGYVEGPDSLFFNPAGLAAGHWTGLGVSLNFSPTFSEFKGPIVTPEQRTSETGFKPVYGALVSYKPFPRLGLGLGSFVSGGTDAQYKDVPVPGFATLRPTFQSNLSVIDFSAGLAYEVLDGLRLGAAWRASYVSAQLQTAAPLGGPPPALLVALDLHDLTDWSWDGFRVGAQYSPRSELWGVGVNWRTPITFRAEGTQTERFEAAAGGGTQTVPDKPVAASAQLPSQISAGAWVSLLDKRLRLLAQYDFTHYAVDRQITLDGTITVPTGPGAPPTEAPLPNIVLNWKDMHNARFGLEWQGFEHWAVRAGYILTTQVTNANFARATLASPGVGNSVLAGAGWRTMNDRLSLDGTFEYSFASGTGTNEFGRTGDFSTRAFVLHLSAGWHM